MTKYLFYYTLTICILSCSQAQSGNQKRILRTSIGNIKFDQAITGFKFTTKIGNKYLYSPNGEKDIHNTHKTSGFYILAVPNIDNNSEHEYLLSFSDGFKEQKEIINIGEDDIKVYNTKYGKATFVKFNVTYSSTEKGIAFQAIVSNGKNAVMFISEDHDNGKFIEKFQKTFESIEE